MKQNYFLFHPLEDEEYLITNELGYYYFLRSDDFFNLVHERYNAISETVRSDLESRGFIYDVPDALFAEKVMEQFRNNKQYLFSGTCLHIFVLTNSCNMNCIYCQAQDIGQSKKGLMQKETAEKAVEIALQSPATTLNFEFQGGEPLLNFSVIQDIIEYAEQNKNDKTITYSVVTNTLALSDEIINYFLKYHVSISTSLDGCMEVQDSNRPKRDGSGTYTELLKNIKRIKNRGLEVGAIQTTTRKSLKYAKEIVDTYLEEGLDMVFVRPLTPLGYAKANWTDIGYSACEFVEFYKEILRYIVECNRKQQFIVEGHAIIFLNKILRHNSGNYMELRSPCGAGIGQIAYYYDGNIYTCDEGRMLGEMGIDTFKIGNVFDSSYQDLMDNPSQKITCQSSVLEALPGCCDCVYHPYCGVCPVVNYASGGNIYAREANSYRCQIYRGILDYLFECIRRNGEEMEVFRNWINGGTVNE